MAHGAAIFFLLLLFLVILPAAGWIGYTRWRAHKNGLPPPPVSAYNPFKKFSLPDHDSGSRPSGMLGWMQNKYQNMRNKRTSGGAYEGSSNTNRRGFGPLDPDGAWDSRVGSEADGYGPVGDYEEQELGLHPPAPGAYGGSGYGPSSHALPNYGDGEMESEIGRGRSRSRDINTSYIGGSQRGLDQRYDEEMGRENPFDDRAEVHDLRGVSPRPVEMEGSSRGHGGGAHDDSPTSRKSMFHENV